MSDFRYQKGERKIIVVTKQMHRVKSRIFAVHRGSSLVVCYGRARLGKTTTAKWIAEETNRHYNPDNGDAFRVVHYQVGALFHWSGNKQKLGIKSLYQATIGRLDEDLCRQLPPEELARQTVLGLKRNAIQMVLVDGAGCLPLEAIQGMVLVGDTAELMHWTLTLVFIGEDDLPIKMAALPQVHGRIREWIHFRPYKLDETWELLRELHPHFKAFDGSKTEHRKQVEFIHKHCGGMPGEIVPFVRKVVHRLNENNGKVDLALLRAVHLLNIWDRKWAFEDSKSK